MDNASGTIYALRPVSFRYHKQYDQTQTMPFGLIAEEVAEVHPDLAGRRNPKGQASELRKVSAQLQISNAAVQAIAKNP
jgi:hypothetical protein